MTVQEFEVQADMLTCKRCATPRPVTFREPANNSTGLQCEQCGLKHCVTGVMWLKTTNKKRRKPYKPEDGLYDVWERNGNVCWVCGNPISFLVLLRIGIERHHPLEYAKTEHDGPVIPVCQPCHTFVTLRQQEAKRWRDRIQDLHGEPVSQSRPDLPGDGLSPDSVRAERQAPVGVVEGISDDDADE